MPICSAEIAHTVLPSLFASGPSDRRRKLPHASSSNQRGFAVMLGTTVGGHVSFFAQVSRTVAILRCVNHGRFTTAQGSKHGRRLTVYALEWKNYTRDPG